MRNILFLILLLPNISISQSQTYSQEELNEYRLANNAYLEARSINSLDSILVAVEKLKQLLVNYPNTISKNGIINHLFDANVLLYTKYSTLVMHSNNLEKVTFSDPERIKELGKLLIELEPMHFNYHSIAEGFRKCGIYLDDAIKYTNLAILGLSDYSNLHMPEYYYTRGKLYLQKEYFDLALASFYEADSILEKVPDEKYYIIITKQVQENKIKVALAEVYMLNGSPDSSLAIYKGLYKNNLEYESLEESYKEALFASGLDNLQVESQLKEDRVAYIDDITFSIKENKSKRPAPVFILKDINDKEVRLTDYLGNVVLLNYWAGWCKPCLAEMPILVDIQSKFSGHPLKVISVNIGHIPPHEYYENLIKEYQINFTILQANSSILSQYHVPPIPKIYVLDKLGNIRFEHTGTSGSLHDKIRIEVEKLLVE